MTINLDSTNTILGILAGCVGVGAVLFSMLRYIIRAETAELRNNGGATIKDKVDSIDQAAKDAKVAAEVAARKAAAAATTATETKDALDLHVRQSAVLIAQGKQDKADIEARQDAQDETIAEQKHTISNLAEALPVVARSTPQEAS